MSKFAVTLNYHGNYGYVEYDSENKKAEIVLGVAEAKAKVEKADFGCAGRRYGPAVCY